MSLQRCRLVFVNRDKSVDLLELRGPFYLITRGSVVQIYFPHDMRIIDLLRDIPGARVQEIQTFSDLVHEHEVFCHENHSDFDHGLLPSSYVPWPLHHLIASQGEIRASLRRISAAAEQAEDSDAESDHEMFRDLTTALLSTTAASNAPSEVSFTNVISVRSSDDEDNTDLDQPDPMDVAAEPPADANGSMFFPYLEDGTFVTDRRTLRAENRERYERSDISGPYHLVRLEGHLSVLYQNFTSATTIRDRWYSEGKFPDFLKAVGLLSPTDRVLRKVTGPQLYYGVRGLEGGHWFKSRVQAQRAFEDECQRYNDSAVIITTSLTQALSFCADGHL
ncbi:hypothetical protein ONZ45_g16759 [Pleurotus djamor]|nr:hypothetical protein ONZ45_g16759 [Pleurotus djamor]